MIAALFVETNGIYFDREDVDPWDLKRDARKYDGPFAIVGHPPCQRFGRYWHGGPSAKKKLFIGTDDGCFKAALRAVRTWGGVLEHPEASHAWRLFGIVKPPRKGGWVRADDFGGYTCCVEQGHYGHRARKATWLYAVDIDLLVLKWGPSAKNIRLDDGFHSKKERALFMKPPKNITPQQRARRRVWLDRREKLTGKTWCSPERLSKRERSATPTKFAVLLLTLATSVPSYSLHTILARLSRSQPLPSRYAARGSSGPLHSALEQALIKPKGQSFLLTPKGRAYLQALAYETHPTFLSPRQG